MYILIELHVYIYFFHFLITLQVFNYVTIKYFCDWLLAFLSMCNVYLYNFSTALASKVK